MPTAGWRRLRDGGTDGVVLTVDFTVAKVRAQASFADLAPQLPEGVAVWSTDETAWAPGPGSSAQQLAHWLESVADLDGAVRAVLGFCGSASLAAALAARLATSGPAPMLVLFDPVTVGSHTMIDQTLDSIHRLGSSGTSDNDVDNGGDQTDLDGLATRLAQRYAEAAAAVGTDHQIPPAIVDQLCQRVAANLRFLTMAAVAWSTPRRAPDLVVLSRDHTAPAEALTGNTGPTNAAILAAMPRPPEDVDGRLVRLPVGQDALLANADAAAAVARLFAGVP